MHGHVADRTLRAAAAAFGVLLRATRRTAAVSDSRGRLRFEGEDEVGHDTLITSTDGNPVFGVVAGDEKQMSGSAR